MCIIGSWTLGVSALERDKVRLHEDDRASAAASAAAAAAAAFSAASLRSFRFLASSMLRIMRFTRLGTKSSARCAGNRLIVACLMRDGGRSKRHGPMNSNAQKASPNCKASNIAKVEG